MPSLEYYTSERFIHDGIVEEARAGIDTLYDTWKRQKGIRTFVIVWPSEAVLWRGEQTEKPVAFDAPEDPKLLSRFLKKVQEKTTAYAILLWRQQEQAVVGVLESRHGTVSWHIPILDHGNVRVLGRPEEHADKDSLGLSWLQS